MPSTPESLQKFVSFVQQHIKGDEKGEAQNFLTDDLLEKLLTLNLQLAAKEQQGEPIIGAWALDRPPTNESQRSRHEKH